MVKNTALKWAPPRAARQVQNFHHLRTDISYDRPMGKHDSWEPPLQGGNKLFVMGIPVWTHGSFMFISSIFEVSSAKYHQNLEDARIVGSCHDSEHENLPLKLFDSIWAWWHVAPKCVQYQIVDPLSAIKMTPNLEKKTWPTKNSRGLPRWCFKSQILGHLDTPHPTLKNKTLPCHHPTQAPMVADLWIRMKIFPSVCMCFTVNKTSVHRGNWWECTMHPPCFDNGPCTFLFMH